MTTADHIKNTLVLDGREVDPDPGEPSRPTALVHRDYHNQVIQLERERHRDLIEAAEELADLVEDHVSNGSRLDSFTTQPVREALALLGRAR